MEHTTGINRREFLGGMAALGGASLLGTTAAAKSAKKKSNLLFIFSDQQSWDMLGCYGNTQIQTPNLDRFAGDGIRFNHAISSYPVCTPYRGMLLSGQHPLYNGCIANDVPLLANNGPCIGNVLGEAGYRMGYVGKWHLLGGSRDRGIPAGPQRHGFDDTFLSNNCHVNFQPGKCFYFNEAGEKVFFDEWEVYGQTRQALSFLDECSEEKPFALFVSWHPPHDMGWQRGTLVRNYPPPPDFADLYKPEDIKLRPSVEDSPAVRRAYAGYMAMCTGVDKAFGWLMDKLQEKGLADDTLVVFTSDHGDNLSSFGHTIPKNHPQDTSIRVPLLMRGPGLASNRKSDLLFGTLDIMPTLLGLLDRDIPETVQGRSLAQAIREGDDHAVASVPLMFYAPQWRGVYTRDHTYAFGESSKWVFGEGKKYQMSKHSVNCLYDHQRDPGQLNNLYGKTEHQALQARLHEETLAWMARFGDDLDATAGILKRYVDKKGKRPNDTTDPDFAGRPIDIVRKSMG